MAIVNLYPYLDSDPLGEFVLSLKRGGYDGDIDVSKPHRYHWDVHHYSITGRDVHEELVLAE